MAQAILHHTAQPVTRPTVDELTRYLATHTVTQAARRWSVNERTIRKWRARASEVTSHSDHGKSDRYEKQTDESNAGATDAPTFAPTSDDIAADNTLWRDPWSGELLPVPPGAHRKAWEAERIAARDRHRAAVQTAQSAPHDGPTVDTMSSETEAAGAPNLTEVDAAAPPATSHPAPAHVERPTPFEAVESDEPRGPFRPMMTLAAADPARPLSCIATIADVFQETQRADTIDVLLLDTLAAHGDANEGQPNIKVIDPEEGPAKSDARATSSPIASDMLAWCYDHMPLVQLAVCLCMVLVLVVLFGA